MEKINVAIIGFGLSGKFFHAPFLLNDQFNLSKIMTSRKEEVNSLIPNAQVVSSIVEILKDPEIELIVNCAPNDFHYSYTKLALEASKHVVVEKPFVNSSIEGEELIELANKNKLVLCVFQNRRWDGDFLTIKELISSNQLGSIMQFESHFDRMRPVPNLDKWRELSGIGNGIWYDLGAHLLDQALNLFGDPNFIQADIAIQRKNAKADDYFHVILFYESLRVILHSTSFGAASPRFQVQGDKATYIKYGLDPQEDALRSGVLPSDENFGIEDKGFYGVLTDNVSKKNIVPTIQGQYIKFYQEIYKAIREKENLPVNPIDALKVIKLIEIGYESSKTGTKMAVNF